MRRLHPISLLLRPALLLLFLGLLAPAALDAQAPPQPSAEVTALLEQGKVAEAASRREEAAERCREALKLARERKDRPGEAASLIGVGRAIIFRAPLESFAHFEEALPIFRELKDRTGEGMCLLMLGNAAQISSQPQKALDFFDASARIALEMGNKRGYSSALTNAATVYIRTGEPYRALEYLERSLAIDRELGRKDSELKTLGNMGAAYRNARDVPRAVAVLEQALTLAQELGSKHDEGIVLLNLGLSHTSMTGPRKGIECFSRAIPLLEGAGDRRAVGAVLTSLAEAYELEGNLLKSLETTHRALDVHRSVGDRNGLGRSLSNLAQLYDAVGQPVQAMEYFQQALQASREAGDRLAQMMILNGIGQLHGKSGRRAQEAEYYEQSLRLGDNETYQDARARTLLLLSVSLARAGKAPQALAHCEEARSLYRASSALRGEAQAELQAGRYLEQLERYADARARYEQSLKLSRDSGASLGEADAAAALAALEEREKRRGQAEEHYKRALSLLEESRERLGGLAEAQAGYLEQQIPVYQGYIRFLLDGNRNAEAFSWAQKAKARVLVDLMEAGKVDVTGAMTEGDRRRERELKQREKVLAQKWQAATAVLEDLRRKPQPDRGRQERAKVESEEVRRQQAQVERDWRVFRDQLYLRNPRAAQQRAARVVTLEEAAAMLPADTALLEYSSLDSGEHGRAGYEAALFVVSREAGKARLRVFRIRTESGALAGKATELREACAGRPGTPAARPYQAVSRELHRLLITPAAAALAGKKRLVICPDGPLWDVPFHALLAPAATAAGKPAPRAPAPSFLWERYAIAYGYSATGTKAALDAQGRPNRPRVEKALLVVANPAFGGAPAPAVGARGAEAGGSEAPHALYLRSAGLAALPSTQVEARAIAAAFPEAVLKTAGDAQESLVKQSAPSFGRLHFATHALFNDTAPMLSGIVLARPPKDSPEDGILTARELFDMSLAANTVVLSACDTARGASRRGEGVIGLTWAIFVAGSPTQVVSQWAVDDQTTAELMGGFYRGLKRGQSKDAALRASALGLLRDGKHQHPFYWAPFLVMGDWR